jgi:hypothetical protein
MNRKVLFGSAAVACAALGLSAGCDDARRDWDVCHAEPCQAGFYCNAQQRCEPIVVAAVEAGADGSRQDGSLLVEGGEAGDGSVEGGADADAPADATGDAARQDGFGIDAPSDATVPSDATAG